MLTVDNSNVTLTELDAYHADRATPGWAANAQPAREAAAIRATDYIGFSYTLVAGVTLTDPAIKKATCALAALAITATLTEQATADVLSEEGDGVGKIEYGKAPADPYPAITAILRSVATRNGGSMRNATALI